MESTIQRADDTTTIRFTCTFGYNARTIWRALTDGGELRHWFPTDMEGARETGAPLRFTYCDDDGTPFEGTMLAYEPTTLLAFTWAEHTLRFELTEEWGSCRLVFSDTFTDPMHAARDAAGWQICLENLEAHLSGRPIDTNTHHRWGRLYPEFVAKVA